MARPDRRLIGNNVNKLNNAKEVCLGLLLSFLLAACGGGSNGESTLLSHSQPANNSPAPGLSTSPSPGASTSPSPDSSPAPAPVPSVRLVLNRPSQALNLAVGDEFPVDFSGSWSGVNVLPGQVYLQARDTSGRFQSAAVINGSAGENFTFTLFTSPTVPQGSHIGTVEFSACKDANCTERYSGASVSIPYSLNVASVSDWETHQRDATHRGYVPIWLNPARFAKAWEFSTASANSSSAINAVVTGNGNVYVTKDVNFAEGMLYALKESDGTETWHYSFGLVFGLNPPAVSAGKVYAAVNGLEQTALWTFNANTGEFIRNDDIEGQRPHVLAPTVHGNQVFTAGGYYGASIYAFSTLDGALRWSSGTGGAWDMFTPAVDDRFVYHHNGRALKIIDRSHGGTTAIIEDPFGATSGASYGPPSASSSYHGSAVIGGRNNVFAFAKTASSGQASSNAEQYDQRLISSFDLGTRRYQWSTSNAYITAPAVSDGVIYAARNEPMSLDAIDEATGRVLWSWVPVGNGDTSFHRNILLTRNILFVSTDKAVYALDLASKTPTWRYPKPGMLAISADRTLYIATGARESDGGLVAVRLK